MQDRYHTTWWVTPAPSRSKEAQSAAVILDFSCGVARFWFTAVARCRWRQRPDSGRKSSSGKRIPLRLVVGPGHVLYCWRNHSSCRVPDTSRRSGCRLRSRRAWFSHVRNSISGAVGRVGDWMPWSGSFLRRCQAIRATGNPDPGDAPQLPGKPRGGSQQIRFVMSRRADKFAYVVL